jgi:hypothetical protein
MRRALIAQRALLFAFNDGSRSPYRSGIGLSPHADVGEGMKQSKNIEQPQNHGNNHDRIQDGLDRSLHRYQVDKPKQNADYDQSAE